LQKDANKRFQTVAELSQALQPFAEPTPRTSLPGPVSSRGTEVMAPLSISAASRSLAPSNGYVVDTGNQIPGSIAKTTLDRPLPEKRSNGVVMIAVGAALAIGAVAGGAIFFLHSSDGPTKEVAPAIASVASAGTEKPTAPSEPHVDATAAPPPASATAVATGTPSAAPVLASSAIPTSSARPSSAVDVAPIPTGDPPQPGTSAPKKAPPLAPSAPGGNPLIL
ncbi:MAG: hypothetical protein JNK04_20040, partial [Myxococcales bacterium]|nr:hypothetical protein [Myxococcales bacterium]